MILVLSATKLLNTVLLQVVSWDGTTMHPKMLKGLENLLRATDSLYNYSCYSLLMECRLKLVQVYCLNSDICTCSAGTICLRLRHTSGSMHDLQLPMLVARLSLRHRPLPQITCIRLERYGLWTNCHK